GGGRRGAAASGVSPRLGLRGGGGSPPLAACLEQAGEVLHDRGPLPARGGSERPLEAAADRLGHLVVERRQPSAGAIVGEPLAVSLAGRGEIGVRAQGREAEHRLLELGGALLPCAPRPA